jgi:hypothetical protein
MGTATKGRGRQWGCAKRRGQKVRAERGSECRIGLWAASWAVKAAHGSTKTPVGVERRVCGAWSVTAAAVRRRLPSSGPCGLLIPSSLRCLSRGREDDGRGSDGAAQRSSSSSTAQQVDGQVYASTEQRVDGREYAEGTRCRRTAALMAGERVPRGCVWACVAGA